MDSSTTTPINNNNKHNNNNNNNNTAMCLYDHMVPRSACALPRPKAEHGPSSGAMADQRTRQDTREEDKENHHHKSHQHIDANLSWNGPHASCHQVYNSDTNTNHVVADKTHCSVDCETHRKPQTASSAQDVELLSDNLLINPNGQEQFKGWRRLSIHDSWLVERTTTTPPPTPGPLSRSKGPPGSQPCAITTNFVSTHFWCRMEQIVDLSQATACSSSSTNTTYCPTRSRIQVSARYRGHDTCPSVFRLEAQLLDGENDKQIVLYKASTGLLSADGQSWQRAVLVLPPPPTTTTTTTQRARFVKILLHGKDGVLRPGHYGSKVTDCSIRVIF